MIARYNKKCIMFIMMSCIICLSVACPPPDCGPCEEWDSELGECVNICETGDCCTSSGCVTVDTDWQTSSKLTVVVDPQLVNAVSNALGEIPNMPAVTCTGCVFAYTEEKRECCNSEEGEIQYERCATGMGAIAGSVDRVTIWSFGGTLKIEVAGFGASLTAELEAYVEGALGTTCYVGKYENDCTDDSCNYGSVSLAGDITLGVEATLEACVIILGADFCVGASISASGTLGFEGSVSLNECGDCSGLSGSISLTEASVTASFSANGNSDEETWDLLE